MKTREGIELLRYAVKLLDDCREDFNTRYSAAELLRMAEAMPRLEWDMWPDQWDQRQIREFLEGGHIPDWCYGRNSLVAKYADGSTGETNWEGLTLQEWTAAANVGRLEAVETDIARQAWWEGVDPSDFACEVES